MKHARAIVEPKILKWARSTAGLSVDEAAKALQTKTDKVIAWESGEMPPSMPQLRKMASVYRRLLSDFYLPSAPAATPIPHDFRRLPGQVASVYSRDLRFEMRAASERRRLALDLYEELDTEPPKLLAQIRRDGAAETIGDKVRDILGITLEKQHALRDSRAHYRAWRSSIEATGVLVFQVVSVPTDQMLGFSIAERPLPVIAINRKLKPNGRTFTMLHEFAHILLGNSSICDLREEMVRPPEEQATEVFCNAVAAAALMPKNAFLRDRIVINHGTGKEDWSESELSELGRRYGASDEAVLRRLLTFSRTTNTFYRQTRAKLLARQQNLDEQKKETDFKRNMPVEVVSNLGRPFTQLVLDTYANARLSLSDVSRFLGLRATQVPKVRELVGA
jgi:Zn-dependent peptidase ImmA (M78 family)/DNA-binding XRE family transcriptional regulator